MSRKPVAKMLAAAACTALLAACSFGSTESAEAAVHDFHRQFSAQSFGEVYAGSDQALKETATAEGFATFMQGLYEKVGAVRETRRTGWNVNVGTSGRIVTLDYETEFANGHGTERFIFRLDGDRARLQGYNLTSPLLIAN